jgi:hypothetical protein
MDCGKKMAAEVRTAMSERWDGFLAGFGEERESPNWRLRV